MRSEMFYILLAEKDEGEGVFDMLAQWPHKPWEGEVKEAFAPFKDAYANFILARGISISEGDVTWEK